MDSPTFVKRTGDLLCKYSWGSLARPVQVMAEVVFPQIARLAELRICHPIHPHRVIEHVLLAVAEKSQPEAVVLALMIAALCHDTAEIPKVTASGRSPRDAEHRRRRILFRLEHEAVGAANLVRAVKSTDAVLKSNGCAPIGLDVVQIAYQVVVNHDAPSREQRLPLDRRGLAGAGEAADALELFVQADTVTIVEYLSPPLRGDAPVGPMAELWAAGVGLAPDKIKAQLASSERSVCRRLRAAFGLPGAPGIAQCFLTPVLGGAAARYLAEWRAELG
jgi:hypothetical protein